jgi:hypothetical protein
VSNNDSFIDEVTEEVRRDRLFALMRKYGWVGVLGIAVLVGGTAYSEWHKRQTENRARAFGDAVVGALNSDDAAARAAALDALAVEGQQKDMLGFLSAAEDLAGGDTAKAAATLKSVAEAPGLPDIYRQLADLKRAMILGKDMPPAERDAVLERLATPGAPFRPLAMELQALALVDTGKTDDAIALARRILEEQGATPALRRRAGQLIVALGGKPDPG